MRGKVLEIDCHDGRIHLQVWEGKGRDSAVWTYWFPLRAIRLGGGLSLSAGDVVEVTEDPVDVWHVTRPAGGGS